MPQRGIVREVYNLSDDELQEVYTWVDGLSLSRPKKNIHRDFSDGLLIAEVIRLHFPKIVDLHNYPAVNSVDQKRRNLSTLCKKVLKKHLGLSLSVQRIEDIASARQYAIERTLLEIREALIKRRDQGAHRFRGNKPTSRSEQHVEYSQNNVNHVKRGARRPHPKTNPMGVNDHHGVVPANNDYQQPYSGLSLAEDLAVNRAHGQHLAAGNKKSGISGVGPGHQGGVSDVISNVDRDLLVEQKTKIDELIQIKNILELKTEKMKQLLRIKDQKIQALQQKLAQYQQRSVAQQSTTNAVSSQPLL